MTPEYLETHYLSVRYWVVRTLLPTAFILLLVLIVIGFLTGDGSELNHASVIAAFFAAYFVLIRAGHLFMIRAMHLTLKKEYAAVYPKKLASLPKNMNRRNLGFSLAKIKSDLIYQQRNLT